MTYKVQAINQFDHLHSPHLCFPILLQELEIREYAFRCTLVLTFEMGKGVLRVKKKTLGTSLGCGPVFRHFEFFDDVIILPKNQLYIIIYFTAINAEKH
jgi:hypothetical protein